MGMAGFGGPERDEAGVGEVGAGPEAIGPGFAADGAGVFDGCFSSAAPALRAVGSALWGCRGTP